MFKLTRTQMTLRIKNTGATQLVIVKRTTALPKASQNASSIFSGELDRNGRPFTSKHSIASCESRHSLGKQ
jgi:hypothetical protein